MEESEVRVTLKSLADLQAMLEKAKVLYDSIEEPNGIITIGPEGLINGGPRRGGAKDKTEVPDKIQLLDQMEVGDAEVVP